MSVDVDLASKFGATNVDGIVVLLGVNRQMSTGIIDVDGVLSLGSMNRCGCVVCAVDACDLQRHDRDRVPVGCARSCAG